MIQIRLTISLQVRGSSRCCEAVAAEAWSAAKPATTVWYARMMYSTVTEGDDVDRKREDRFLLKVLE